MPNEQILSKDVIFDIKTIMKDFYFAEFSEKGNELAILFYNGQKFIVSVKAC